MFTVPFICTLFYVCVVNVPFGYLRAAFPKFTVWWFVMIHAPIPIIIGVRVFFEIEFSWQRFPFLLAAYFIGQFIGMRMRKGFFRPK